MRPEVPEAHDVSDGGRGQSTQSRHFLDITAGDLEKMPAVELDRQLEGQHKNNTETLDELKTSLREHSEFSNRYGEEMKDLNRRHENMTVLLEKDPAARQDIAADPELQTLTREELTVIGNRLQEIKAAVEEARGKTEAPPDQPGPRETSDTTQHVTSDSPLVRQAESSGMSNDEACTQHLERIDRGGTWISELVDRASRKISLLDDLSDSFQTMKSELSTAMRYCDLACGIDQKSLAGQIQKIHDRLGELFPDWQPPGEMLPYGLNDAANRLRGFAAELNYANQTIEAEETASHIVFGLRGRDGEYRFERRDAEPVPIRFGPINDVDVAYVKKDTTSINGQAIVCAVEIKNTPPALIKTLEDGGFEQLYNLAIWQSVASDNVKREAIIAIQTPLDWPKLAFHTLYTGQTALDALIENKVALQIDGKLLDARMLKDLKLLLNEKWETFSKENSGARRKDFYTWLYNNYSPKSLLEGQ